MTVRAQSFLFAPLSYQFANSVYDVPNFLIPLPTGLPLQTVPPTILGGYAGNTVPSLTQPWNAFSSLQAQKEPKPDPALRPSSRIPT